MAFRPTVINHSSNKPLGHMESGTLGSAKLIVFFLLDNCRKIQQDGNFVAGGRRPFAGFAKNSPVVGVFGFVFSSRMSWIELLPG